MVCFFRPLSPNGFCTFHLTGTFWHYFLYHHSDRCVGRHCRLAAGSALLHPALLLEAVTSPAAGSRLHYQRLRRHRVPSLRHSHGKAALLMAFHGPCGKQFFLYSHYSLYRTDKIFSKVMPAELIN